ncbi:MAG: ring-cleaving dioxygenase [Rhodobacteraceae bacterium]|nr:ring-cleaving dioxygenase [Paracoccaceae bacterium]
MLTQIKGLHHVTSLASSAQANNAFFTGAMGLRRVKKTVNFDAPDVYHLYYGDGAGTPGSVMTYFPFPNAARGKRGVGEVSRTAFAVPQGSLDHWAARLDARAATQLAKDSYFGAPRLRFAGPDGDEFALIEGEDTRAPWADGDVDEGMAVRGFHSAAMRLADGGATAEVLRFMGYEASDRDGDTQRFILPGGNGADAIDVETIPGADAATQGAGSVHHIAFAVENREAQLEVRKTLLETGHQVTPVINRDYFWAIYFRTPGGVLFEVATNEPGFDVDEDTAHLGEALKLPKQHAHLRDRLEATLEPIG